jgi:hypothetical protein
VADLDADITVIDHLARDGGTSLAIPAHLADAARAVDTVVFVAGPAVAGEPAPAALQRGFWPLVRIGAALAAARPGTPTRLLVIAPQPDDAAHPESELLTGPCRVLPQE